MSCHHKQKHQHWHLVYPLLAQIELLVCAGGLFSCNGKRTRYFATVLTLTANACCCELPAPSAPLSSSFPLHSYTSQRRSVGALFSGLALRFLCHCVDREVCLCVAVCPICPRLINNNKPQLTPTSVSFLGIRLADHRSRGRRH